MSINKSIGDERRALEEVIQRRNQKFALQGTMDINGMMQELPKNQEYCEDSEEKQLVKAYKLSGEAKLSGITDFLDTMFDNDIKFILFAHH